MTLFEEIIIIKKVYFLWEIKAASEKIKVNFQSVNCEMLNFSLI